MYRQVLIPNERNSEITFPPEWYGKKIEVFAFPLSSLEESQQEIVTDNRRRKLDNLLNNFPIDLSEFKFNRDEANNYD